MSPTLGTFAPTPYLMVRGNWPAGGGYSPLDTYGDMTLPLYGPLSSLRTTSAPVTIYSRGYNGALEATPATSFSNPNLPASRRWSIPDRRITTMPRGSIAVPLPGPMAWTGLTSSDRIPQRLRVIDVSAPSEAGIRSMVGLHSTLGRS